MDSISFRRIGLIKSPFKTAANMPIQPIGAQGVSGQVHLNPELVDGLKDLEGFSHLILIYHFHQSKGFDLQPVPFLDDQAHGVFATRAPSRPNPIGLSIVELKSIDGNILNVEGLDILDDTPLLDIKPFFPKFDNREAAVSGWLDEKWQDAKINTRSDSRFK